MIQGALNFGKVVIILNSDEWVRRHKRVLMMPWQDRREVLLSIRGVSAVEPVDDSDGTVREALRRLRPHMFGNGGFRTKQHTPESELCHELGIVCVWGIGGGERDVYDAHVLESIKATSI
jgi:D-beta-D-heptose 7-phosphate kinase/D-beta-D-heptose 1-phosphate adenosyltransferase